VRGCDLPARRPECSFVCFSTSAGTIRPGAALRRGLPLLPRQTAHPPEGADGRDHPGALHRGRVPLRQLVRAGDLRPLRRLFSGHPTSGASSPTTASRGIRSARTSRSPGSWRSATTTGRGG
jgi:hypothetical protein